MARTLLITGGSQGIGAAVARLGAAEGRDVILTYATNKAAAESVAEAVRAQGRKATIIQCDTGVPADIDALYDAIPKDLPIDLVNNAGIVGMTAKVTDLTAERLERIFAVNVVGAILVAKKAVEHMRAAPEKGHIVNISSAAAKLGSANQYVDYAATKGAIDTLTLGLADELAPEGIRVNAIRPGIIDTDIHAKGGDPDRVERISPMVPMRRAGSAEEVAKAALWLLSDAASYTTRSFLEVTGGR